MLEGEILFYWFVGSDELQQLQQGSCASIKPLQMSFFAMTRQTPCKSGDKSQVCEEGKLRRERPLAVGCPTGGAFLSIGFVCARLSSNTQMKKLEAINDQQSAECQGRGQWQSLYFSYK